MPPPPTKKGEREKKKREEDQGTFDKDPFCKLLLIAF